jgi:Cu/Ag efflux protein CusF
VKKLTLSLFAVTLLAAGAAFADTYSGEITKIDRASKSIEVRGGEPARKKLFFLSRKGEVTRAGAPVAFRELKRGDRVEIAFQRSGSTHTATQIAIAGAPADAIATRE